MLRRRGGPGVLSTMARTAVISGTATATMNAVNRRGTARAAAGQPQAAAPVAPPVPAAPEAPGDAGEMVERLTQLAQLRESGMLTEEEFAAAKARLLA
jgi:hypothetical protein